MVLPPMVSEKEEYDLVSGVLMLICIVGVLPIGTWPYVYDSCDIGTLANQTYSNGTGPEAALTTGSNNGTLSYLAGQRVSACTCAGEDHPGPSHDVGRNAAEIDIIEAQVR